jgi:Haloacid dehalogenase superfamily, subfamily IA, variant 2 with 3rd motif like haloacid dehalogenase/haloacid dehalogenase superfamily, subfamily IA, variant 1 with third motif having Dx(3-4)D or Dx(3-4)E
MKYEWITFDCYGTLIDWENGITTAFERVSRRKGVPFDRNQILKLYARYEMEEEHVYKRYREVLSRVARRICVELGMPQPDYSFLAESLPRWRPFADTNTVLERLAKKYKLGILSNIDIDLFNETRRHFTVPFEFVITAEEVASYKPAPAHFQTARRKLGNAAWLHAAQSFVHDIVPCNKLEIDSAWINRKSEVTKDPKIKPVFEGRDLVALENWLQGES